MSRNKTTVFFGNKKFLVVDLTEPLSLKTEVFPKDPKTEKIVFRDIRKAGCQYHIYAIGDHVFRPHGDAPSHQNIGLQHRGFEVFGLGYCFNSACLIDLSNSPESKEFDGIKYLQEVKLDCLKPFEGIISQRGAVIIRTGYDKWLEANKPHSKENIPFLSKSASKFLATFRKIKVVGIDSLTVDACKEKPFHEAHSALKNKLIVESMVHLHEIPLNSRENFCLQTSPVRIVGATGGPIVAYAFIELP